MGRRGHGEGSIYKRKDGVWTASIDLGRGPDGKRRRKVLYGQSRREVADKLVAEQSRVQTGTSIEPTKMTVAEFCQRWLDHTKATCELRTWVDYESRTRVHIIPALGELQLSKLKPMHIQTLYDDRIATGKSARTVVHIHEVLHNMLQQAVLWQLLPANPADRVRRPRPVKRSMKFLDFQQARRFIDELESDRLGSLHLVAVMTGMRQGELLGARWSDLDFESGQLTVSQTVWIYKGEPVFKPYPKDREARILPLSPIVLSWLRSHRARQNEEKMADRQEYRDRGLIWARPGGLPLRGDTMLKHLHKLLARAGLPQIRFHDLRHSAASLLLALGVPLPEVSKTLGHASVEITADLYGHLMPDAQKESALKLEARLLGGKRRSLG